MRFLAPLSLLLAAFAGAPASAQQARAGEKADVVVVDKSERTLCKCSGSSSGFPANGLDLGDEFIDPRVR